MPRRRIPGPILPQPLGRESYDPDGPIPPPQPPSDVSPYLIQPHETWRPDVGQANEAHEVRGWRATEGPDAPLLPSYLSPSQLGPHHVAVDTVTQGEGLNTGFPGRQVPATVYVNTRSPTTLEMEEPWRLEHPRLPGFDDNTGRSEPWQQTREEFAADPRSWHHAAHPPGNESTMEVRHAIDVADMEHPQGLHLGTMQAALNRRADYVGPRLKSQVPTEPVQRSLYDFAQAPPSAFEGKYGRSEYPGSAPIYSYRLRDTPSGAVRDMGDSWDTTHFGKVYQNRTEDPYSTSMVVRRRADLMSHHDFINEALKAGKDVPAHVMAEYGVKDWDRLSPQEQSKYRSEGVKNVPTPIQTPTWFTHSLEYIHSLSSQSSIAGEGSERSELEEHAEESPIRRVLSPRASPKGAIREVLATSGERFGHYGLPPYLQGNLFHSAATRLREEYKRTKNQQGAATASDSDRLATASDLDRLTPHLESVYQRVFDAEKAIPKEES